MISSTSRQWEAAIGRYSALFTASGIRTQDILLRLSNPKLYIVYVHEYLEGLEDEWEDRLTMWTFGVQNAVEVDGALPFFPVVVAAPPEETHPALESDHLIRGKLEQGGAALEATESSQTVWDRDATPAGQSGPPRTRPNRAASTTPGAAASKPSSERGGGSVARSRQGQPRSSGKGARAASGETGRYEPGANILRPRAPRGVNGGKRNKSNREGGDREGGRTTEPGGTRSNRLRVRRESGEPKTRREKGRRERRRAYRAKRRDTTWRIFQSAGERARERDSPWLLLGRHPRRRGVWDLPCDELHRGLRFPCGQGRHVLHARLCG